jgi:hypothetical protein
MRYVRLVDISTPSRFLDVNGSDGFGVDAVEAILPEPPSPIKSDPLSPGDYLAWARHFPNP